MASFQISISPSRRAAARFVGKVRRSLQRAFVEENTKDRRLNQSELARRIGVDRSVIHRELRGTKDISMSRVGQLAWAMGRAVEFNLIEIETHGGNGPHHADGMKFTNSVDTAQRVKTVDTPKYRVLA